MLLLCNVKLSANCPFQKCSKTMLVTNLKDSKTNQFKIFHTNTLTVSSLFNNAHIYDLEYKNFAEFNLARRVLDHKLE